LPQRPKRTLRVVLFANEEQGIWGAKAYARAHVDELSQHVFASESDFGAGKVWRFDVDSPVLMSAAMPLLQPLGIAQGGKASSGGPDIKPLIEAGVAVFRLMQDGTDYFDVHHTADDTLDKIDPASLQQNVAAWAVVTYLAAELDAVVVTSNTDAKEAAQ
jgi:carboxypeptidase Q